MLPITIPVCHFLRLDGIKSYADKKIGKSKVFLLFSKLNSSCTRFNARVNENTVDGTLTDIGIGRNTSDLILSNDDYWILNVGHGSS